MPDKPLKRPRDPAQLAKLMIDIASGEVTEGQPTAKQTRGHKAGTKGGPNRSYRRRSAMEKGRLSRVLVSNSLRYFHLFNILFEIEDDLERFFVGVFRVVMVNLHRQGKAVAHD